MSSYPAYDEEAHYAALREDGYDAGYDSGKKDGYEEGSLKERISFYRRCIASDIDEEKARSLARLTEGDLAKISEEG